MAHTAAHQTATRRHSALTLAALTACLFLGACAGGSELLPSTVAVAGNGAAVADASGAPAGATADPQEDLRKATEYWGQQYRSKPADKTTALSYAKNLKALGDKRQALSVLQDVASLHQRDPEVASELGRLAVEFDQLNLASRMLEVADVPEKPDWRVISARGTVLAKQGQHKAAIPFYERALQISPNQPAVLNNLAMATAMSGDAQKAEEILRQIAQLNGAPAKVNQNLALVLGLQGKYDESKSAGAAAGSTDVAAANTDYLKRMVRLPAKASPPTTQFAKSDAFKGTTAAATEQAAVAGSNARQAAAAMKPAAVENTSGTAWQTAVTADAGAGLKGSKR